MLVCAWMYNYVYAIVLGSVCCYGSCSFEVCVCFSGVVLFVMWAFPALQRAFICIQISLKMILLTVRGCVRVWLIV